MGLMKRFAAVMGRTAPPQANVDDLFALPGAALSVQAGLDYAPTGIGAVCFRAVEGGDFARVQTEVQQVLDVDDGPKVEASHDDFGFTWLTVRSTDTSDVSGIVTDLHAVNRALEDNGYGPALLCSLLAFANATGDTLGLVYLYKRGTFYPFAPRAQQRRDSALELQTRTVVAGEVRIEPELPRWFALWGAPGL